MPRWSRLLVGLAPVRNSAYIDGSGGIVDDINYPIVPDTNPPFFIAALQFLTTPRPGNEDSSSRLGKMRAITFFGSPRSSFSALAANLTR